MLKVEKPEVEEKDLIDSKRCCLIVNKNSGFEFTRSLRKEDKWDVFYAYARRKPEEFECFFDKNITKATELQHRYSKDELDNFAMPKLREIGRGFGVTGVSKVSIISNILEAQDTCIEE